MKRFEENENQVVLYFTELDNEPICVPFSINENSKIEARVDAFVKLYDYYNPEWNVMRVSAFAIINDCLFIFVEV